MKSNSKKKYNQVYIIILLIVGLVLLFQTSWGSDLFNRFWVWKGSLQNSQAGPITEAQSINLDNLYYYENLDLKERLDYQVETNRESYFFSVVSKGDSNIYNTFLISDPHEVLTKGDLVLGKFNLALGWVVGTGEIAKMELFSTNGKKNNFLLVDVEKDIIFDVEAVGQGGGLLKVIVNREIELSSNTVLKLIENEEYLVAKLVKEEFKTQDPNRILFFQIFVNPYALNKVEVEK